MSCKNDVGSPSSINVSGNNTDRQIEALIKAASLEEANKLIKEGHIFLTAYWNANEGHEEYILGKFGEQDKTERQVGFLYP